MKIARLLLVVAITLPALAHGQTVSAFGSGVQDGTGALNTGGQWCFGATCLSVSSGAFSGSITPGTQTVTVKNSSSTTVLTVPNVTAQSGQSFNWNQYVIPINTAVTGTGSPYLPCYVGSSYNGSTWCQSYSGQTLWGNIPTPVSSGPVSGYGVPAFYCVAPCQFFRVDTGTLYGLTQSHGLSSNNWTQISGVGSWLPTGGGTLTGALNGTTANFPSGITGPLASGPVGAAGYAPSGRADLRAFGAKGDGVTDDTTAWQNAINYAVAHQLNLYVPPPPAGKCYLITKSLNIENPGGVQAQFFSIIGENPAQGGSNYNAGYVSICHALTEAYPVFSVKDDYFGEIRNIAVYPNGNNYANSQATACLYMWSNTGVGAQFTVDHDVFQCGAGSTDAGVVISGADQVKISGNTDIYSAGTPLVWGAGIGPAAAVTSKFNTGAITSNMTECDMESINATSSGSQPGLYMTGCDHYLFGGNNSFGTTGATATSIMTLNDSRGFQDIFIGGPVYTEIRNNPVTENGLVLSTGLIASNIWLQLGAGSSGAALDLPLGQNIDSSTITLLGGGPAFALAGTVTNSTIIAPGAFTGLGTLAGSFTNSNLYVKDSVDTAPVRLASLTTSGKVCLFNILPSPGGEACTEMMLSNGSLAKVLGSTSAGFFQSNSSGAGFWFTDANTPFWGVHGGSDWAQFDGVNHFLYTVLNNVTYKTAVNPTTGITAGDFKTFGGSGQVDADAGFGPNSVYKTSGTATPGQLACIKSAGPPPVLGTCTAVSGAACTTCN